jgi:hypothetical protein
MAQEICLLSGLTSKSFGLLQDYYEHKAMLFLLAR